MKKTIILVSLLILLAACSAVPKNVEQAKHIDSEHISAVGELEGINHAESKFEFEGYALGRKHNGTFKNWTVELVRNGKITGGKVIIQADSVKTDIERLTNHLKSEDFFHAEKYPEIVFEVTSIGKDSVTGNLTFHGVTEQITFPAEITQNSVKAEFLLDTKPFNMRYVGVDRNVRITFEIYSD